MRNIENVSGTGTITTPKGEVASVQYEIQVWQKQIPAGNLSNPTATIPGVLTISGRVSPARFFGAETLTLNLEDGRSAKFIYKDSNGNIHVNYLSSR